MLTCLQLLLGLCLIMGANHGGSAAHNVASQASRSERELKHHHCIHDAKLDEFDETVDKASLTVPQNFGRAVPSDNDQSTYLESFLDAVGVASITKKQRSLTQAASSAATFQPIRIAFDLSKLSSDPGFMCTQENEVVTVDGASYTCSSSDVATPAKIEFIESVLLQSIQDWFGSILSVQQVFGNLIIAGISCSTTDVWACCANSIPATYKTTGVANADFVLHVTARPTTGLVLAWALPCNTDQYGRPISGQANFGPGRLDPTTPANRDSQIATALHEMTHALVFSSSLFANYRQPLNGAIWGYNNVVSQVQGVGGIYVSKIITPNVVKQAKQHFNCYDWADAGFELENGPSGSASFSSHWEKRVAMNEYMTATSSYDSVYSAFTLALFEDSGWYQVSYATAQVLPWGFMEGCGVAQSRCSTWNSRYICQTASQQACTSDYNAKGYCNVASYQSSIPAGFQYFQDPTFGGKDSYADYCPFYRAYSNGDCRGIGTVSTLIDATNRMEVVGLTSKCFSSNLNLYSGNSAAIQASCFPVLGCTSNSLRLTIGSTEVQCPIAGGNISVNGYYGQIVCPVANKLCQLLQGTCSGNGVLLTTGACSCNPGYVGANCNGTSCPQSNGVECSGSDHGVCDYSTGNCACTSMYTGLSCSELVCPALSDKNTLECSGYGSCNRANGTCTCNAGYSGKSCECVPGCSTTQCGGHGTCDCMSGGCSCDHGYSGVTCNANTVPTVTLLTESNNSSLNATVPNKGYAFYKIYMNSSSYDITFIVRCNNISGVDVDLYGSFDDPLPTATSAKANLFSSVYSGPLDEINLCGTLGVFPRGLSDAFRYCPRSTSSYVTGTPGYFYLSVFGYAGGSYSLSIETDKCRGVTCSNHGECGVDYPGICSCDRYWTGESCNVPKCGPDCIDLGTCANGSTLVSSDTSLGDYVTSVILADNPLRNTSECYGNGVCQVLTDSNGNDIPTCVCDDPFSFSNPTPNQALCKELVPSVAYIEHFTEPFTITTDILELQVDVDDWALFTLQVKDEWQIIVANLEIESTGTDTMLFIRKDKIPSVMTSANSSSYVQYTDSSGWASGSSTRKIVLNRASSTLSSGLYYVGIYNSAYAYSSLSYTLTVNATANCTANSSSTVGDTFGVCANNGTCSALSSTVCTCPSGFVGTYCDLKATRSVLSANSSASSSSYMAFTTPNATLLPVGDWMYYSFEVNDSSAHAVQFTLWIENDMSVATPVFPLLLVRGPNDDGFPNLFVDNMQDFQAISTNAANQTVSLAIDTVCSFATQQRDCYKIAVFNRAYSGSTLRYHVQVTLMTSKASVYPLQTCGNTGSAVNCYGRGTCLMLQDTTTSSLIPSCTCASGWMGMRCNSPKSFDLPQLWSSMSNISLLCSTCESQFTLARGEIKMFRIPESLRADTGLRIHVGSTSSSSSSSSSSAPNVYVSETRPRSIYDFTHISTANASSSEQSVALTNSSITGSFWVVVYNAYSTTGSSALTSSSSASQLGSARRRLHRDLAPPVRPGLRSLDTSAQMTRALTSSDDAGFRLIVDVYSLSGDSSSSLITTRSFIGEIVHWLLHTIVGLAVLVCSALLLLFVLVFCLWRVSQAPENQDRQTKRHFSQRSPAQIPVAVQLASVARGGALVHASDSQL